MYRVLKSFTTATKQFAYMQILEDDFTTQEEIDEFLESNYIEPYDDTIEIVENGLYDVEDYEKADVNVPSGEPTLQSKSVTINQNTTVNIQADEGYDGLSSVAVTTNVTPNLQNKSVTITENTTTTIQADSQYDGLGQVEVTTNVSGGSIVLPDGIKFENSTVTNHNWLSNADTSNLTDTYGMFKSNANITTIPLIDTSNSTKFGQMFWQCLSLVTIPQLNSSKSKTFTQMCLSCTSLENVPFFDMSQAGLLNGKGDISSMFASCPALTNESLNNILASLATITYGGLGSGKKLSYIGLTQEQATTCTGLSNWSALSALGWTTGY